MPHPNASIFWMTVGVSILALACPAVADEPIDCAKAMSTVEINFCADKDYQAADKVLNETYALALKFTRDRNLEKPYDAKSFEEALRNAQRSWIAYRDAECKGVVPQQFAGGTITTSAILGCMTRETVRRTKELKDLMDAQ